MSGRPSLPLGPWYGRDTTSASPLRRGCPSRGPRVPCDPYDSRPIPSATRRVTRRRWTDSSRGSALPEAAFFPAVVKPHRSVVTVGRTRRKLVVTPVADAAACRGALAGLPPAAFPVLLQRWVDGVGEGFFGLRWGGRTVATFAHRRLREKPPSGGVSVYRE